MKKLFALLLALCMVWSAGAALGENATQEIQVGKVTLQIPSELTGGAYNTNDFIEGHNYACERYGMTIASFDLAFMETDESLEKCLSRDRIGDDNTCALYWSLQLFAGWDAKLAMDVSLVAREFFVTPDDSALLVYDLWNGYIMSAHTYNGTGICLFLFARDESVSQTELELITLEIASSICMEDVSAEMQE